VASFGWASFDWQDPFLIAQELSDEERMIMETARDYAQAKLAPRVRVNCIAPSLTDTPLAARMLSSDAMRKALGEAHPIPRVGAPDDVAALAELLLEPTSFINGQVLAVDGGRSTLRPKN